MNAAQASATIMRSTAWNLVGAGLPIIIALVTVPILIRTIGTDRFGVLTIAWVVLGYFGLFDLGLGGATTKFLAHAFERGKIVEGRAVFWTSLTLSAFLGLVGGITLAALTPLLVDGVLNVPVELRTEAKVAFYLMASSVPAVTLLTSTRGALEAQHRFGLVNLLHVPTAALTQLAPLLILPFSSNIAWLVGSLVLSRLLGLAVFFIAVLLQMESPFAGPFFLRDKLGALLAYGGWLTVTNVVGPLMVYADRFVVGSIASMTAVSYYTTPYEAVTRLWILPQSLTRTMFPIFSAETDVRRRNHLYVNAVRHLALILAPIVATVIVFAPDLLRAWIGEAFATNSAFVLQILAVGVFINSLALIPFTLLQGLGKPDVTAKFHLLELPLYLLLLVYGVWHYGIAGAALAWTARVGFDALLLTLYVRLSGLVDLRARKSPLVAPLLIALLIISSGCLLGASVGSLVPRMVIWSAILAASALVTWQAVLAVEERREVMAYGPATWARIRDKNRVPKKGRER